LLDDEDLRRVAAAEIDADKSAAFGWRSATEAAADSLRQTGNSRMQERIADLKDIGDRVVRALAGPDALSAVELPKHAVLIAEELLPSELLSLDRNRLAAIAVERGGATSHMAIIAGSFGVPTLVAMGPSLSRVHDGQRVLVDAVVGKLVIEPAADVAERALKGSSEAQTAAGDARTRDGQRVTLLANLGGVSEVARAAAAGAEGCGLLRSEFLFLDRDRAPNVEEQRATYQSIADALAGRPLTIRTLDIGGDKPVPFIDFGREENPALGARGVRMNLVQPELIDDQLRAIAQVQSDALKVMVPMLSSVDELRRVRERWADLSGGRPIKLGAMVETPAAALIAETLAQEGDFLSIGTNDLAQYALAMDRTNALLAPFIDALHPAVLRLIAMTAEAGARMGTPVSVCGNLASDPVGALLLVGFGIRELSGVPAALPMVRHVLAQVTTDQCRELAARALKMESAAQVRALAAGLLKEGAGE
jgi:phosphocarrier protein FPr/phosphocarrier protein